MRNVIEKLKKQIFEKRIYCFVCLLVLIESFFAERLLFHFEQMTIDRIGLYLLAKLGIIFITLLLCYLVEYCKKNWDDKRIRIFIIAFSIIMCIYIIYMFLGWPGLWLGDNHIIFCMALKFDILPQQSVITTLIYIICLMVIPHPVAVVFFQLFVAALIGAYVISFLYTLISSKKILWLVILFVSFPAVYFLMQTMRNAVYGYLLLLLEIIFIELFNKEKLRKIKYSEIMGIAGIVGLLSAWRGEGIAILCLFILMVLLFYRQIGVKKIVVVFSMVLSIFLLFSVMDSSAWAKIGAKERYSLTPFITGVSKIVSNQMGNYEQYGEDLANIDKVISVKALAEHPSDLAPFNWEVDGVRADFTKEEYNACIKSICRMILYNLDLYLDSKWHLLVNSCGAGFQQGYISGQWNRERHLEILRSFGEERLFDLFMPLNEKVSTGFYNTMIGYYNVLPYTLMVYYFIWSLWIPLVILVVSNIYFLCKGKYNVLFANLFVLAELGMMFMLCAAEGAYYYSMFYLHGWINLVLMIKLKNIKN